MGLEEDNLKEKMLKWEQNKPAFKQVQLLSDLADMMQESVSVLDAIEKGGQTNAKQFGALLTDIREKLSSLDDREEPETQDYAKPVLEGFKKLEKALTASIKGIDVKPVVNVDTPAVNVNPPSVDLKGVEKVLKTDLPKAFDKAIQSIPKPSEIKIPDYSKKFDEMVEWLKSIDTASRLKQAGVNAKITNATDITDGLATETKQDDTITAIEAVETAVGNISGSLAEAVIDPRTGYGISDKEATATYKYFGFEDADGKWYILRKTIATNIFLYAAGTSGYATAWTNRASQTYDTFDTTFSPVTGSVITAAVQINTYQSNPTATLSNVASSASSVTLLALNTSRKGMTIYNDSTQVLYVKFGTTASSSSYTIKMAADAYYEAPFGYTGRIDGIWASANGNARITEIT